MAGTGVGFDPCGFAAAIASTILRARAALAVLWPFGRSMRLLGLTQSASLVGGGGALKAFLISPVWSKIPPSEPTAVSVRLGWPNGFFAKCRELIVCQCSDYGRGGIVYGDNCDVEEGVMFSFPSSKEILK
jgi:hypothetical protein